MNRKTSLTSLLVAIIFILTSIFTFSTTTLAAPAKVTSLTLPASTTPLYLKQTIQLKPTVTTSPKNSPVKITYTSSNTKVASVSDKGLITGVGVGQVSIQASSGGKSSKVLLSVKSKVKQLSLSVPKSRIALGEKTTLNVKLTMDNEKLPKSTLKYSVKDPSIIFLEDNGQITALKEGTTEVTVMAEEKSSKIIIIVSDINWSLDNEVDQDSNISWNTNSSYAAINHLIVDVTKGHIVKKMGNESVFSQNTLYQLKTNSLLAYDSNFKLIKTYDFSHASSNSFEIVNWGKYHKAFSSDGKYLFYSTDYEIEKYDLTMGSREQKYGPDDILFQDSDTIALSKDGSLLWAHDRNAGNAIYSTSNKSSLVNLSYNDKPTFSTDVQKLALINRDGVLNLLNTTSANIEQTMDGSFNDVSFSSDRRFMAAANINGNVDIFDAKSLELIKSLATKSILQGQKLESSVSIPMNISFSPNGQQLLATYKAQNNDPGIISWNITQLGKE
ncbi:Ig-like domain-containing protein [Paenibacillus odorifer]|uniref:Ig-like domain-containing protein n=1 Tax=Paenibacillus odorifer TaxID=189426 RepID=UPI00289E663D|nr:Ig-like domain-containing protein [Paenibacillus odorifer]